MKFAIAAPEYDARSAGRRVLYYLDELLNRAGHSSRLIYCRNNGEKFGDSRAQEDEVVVYPDCYRGNPLEAKRIVRYMLYYADAFFENDPIPSTELPICYHQEYYDSIRSVYQGGWIPVLQIPCIEPELFHPEEKSIENVIYVGKGKRELADGIEGEMVDNNSALSREEFAALLRKARNVYIADAKSVVLAEAHICGCKTWKLVEGQPPSEWQSTSPTLSIMDRKYDVTLAFFFAELCAAFWNVPCFPEQTGVKERDGH